MGQRVKPDSCLAGSKDSRMWRIMWIRKKWNKPMLTWCEGVALEMSGQSHWRKHYPGDHFGRRTVETWSFFLVLQCLWHTMCMWNLSEDLESKQEFMRNSWLFGCFAGAKYKATGRQLPTIRAPFIGRALFASILWSTMSFFLDHRPSWKSQLLIDSTCAYQSDALSADASMDLYTYIIHQPHLGSTVYLSKHL